MKTALEPYVIDFLLWRGYQYFLIQTHTCQDLSTSVLLQPCFVKPDKEGDEVYVDILKRHYVVENEGHKEWMWVNFPDYEIVNLRIWQIRHYTSTISPN